MTGKNVDFPPVTAVAHPNIAFIKYWGNINEALRLPANGSISMNLAELSTTTTVRFDPTFRTDQITLNGYPSTNVTAKRVSDFLDLIRTMSGINLYCEVISANNFPSGSGIASSASGFAALAAAGSAAAGLSLSAEQLSRLARRGSGSACRSIPSGITEWLQSDLDERSYAIQLVSESHWDLVDLVTILDSSEKKVGSTEGHQLASTSPLQSARLADTPRRLKICRDAILARDFETFADTVEEDCLQMHAVMMTSQPALIYWQPATLAMIHTVSEMHQQGIPVSFTIDAGANVHVITLSEYANQVQTEIQTVPGVQKIIRSGAGGGTILID